jgi:hypothetical protein
MGQIAGVDDVEKGEFLTLPGLEFRSLGRAARRKSLYRLSYPGSCCVTYVRTGTILRFPHRHCSLMLHVELSSPLQSIVKRYFLFHK